jgi:hypothetical protein
MVLPEEITAADSGQSSMPPGTPVESAPALPRRAWLAFATVCALAFLHFWISTMPVRFSNNDDLVFQKLADEDTTHVFMVDNAASQARFYFCTPLFGVALSGLYEISTPWLFSFLRTAAIFAQIGLAGWLLARVTAVPALGAALGLMILATHHVPLTYYPVLSYPFDWLGCIAALGALHFHLSYVRKPAALAGCGAAVLFLIACLMHEIFVLFFPLFMAVSWLQPGGNWAIKLRATLGPVVVAAAYVSVHALFSRQFPSTYDGTQFSFNPIPAGQVVIRQLIGIVPGFELVVHRLSERNTTGPLFREIPAILETLRNLRPWDYVLGLLEAITLSALLLHAARTIPPLMRLWPWGLALAAWFNVPIAFSVKYQVFILHREFPYAYAFYSFFFLCLAILGATTQGLHWAAGRLEPRVLAGIVGLGAALVCLSALASNQRVFQVLVEKYN